MSTSVTETMPSGSGIELQSFFQPEGETQKKIGIEDLEDIRATVVPPIQAVPARQRWNAPKQNVWRVLATFWSFFVVGMNDGSYGALVPLLEKYYDLSYTVVSLIFLSPFVGYSIAALVNNLVHVKFGQRGVAFMGPLCHVVSYLVLLFHPPYPVMVVMFIFIGFGNGLIDAAWCAWLGNMANANEVQGFLQACYSLGGTVAPLIATALTSKGGLQWYSFYYIMVATSAFELVTSAFTFWPQTGAVYLAQNPRDPSEKGGRTRQALKNKLTWIFALFFFGYVGAEVSLGGWVVTFMTRVRSATPFASGLTATGYWAGMTVGRLCLGFVTGRLGEYRATLLYLFLAAGFELIFWLVPNLFVSAVFVAFLGFVMGPMFPTAIIMITILVPQSQHVGTIGFATAFGGSGGAVFPFLVGAIAQAKGVKTLQPVILGILGALSLLWVFLPRKGKERREEHEEGNRLAESSS